jgi:hypothetical protein
VIQHVDQRDERNFQQPLRPAPSDHPSSYPGPSTAVPFPAAQYGLSGDGVRWRSHRISRRTQAAQEDKELDIRGESKAGYTARHEGRKA